MATIAVFGVVAGGGAYAASNIGTQELKRNSVTSPKIDNRTIKGKDVKDKAIGPRQLRDGAIDVPGATTVAGRDLPDCNPSSAAATDCGSVAVRLTAPGRIIAIATGGQYSQGAVPASAACEVRVDGVPRSVRADPGEVATDNTDSGNTNGFSRTVVEPSLPGSPLLSAGSHTVTLACSEFGGDAAIASPTLAAIAVPGG
jgi:hypothetical protein